MPDNITFRLTNVIPERIICVSRGITVVGFQNSANAPRNTVSCNIHTDSASLRRATTAQHATFVRLQWSWLWVKQFRSRFGGWERRRRGTKTERWAYERANTRSSKDESLWLLSGWTNNIRVKTYLLTYLLIYWISRGVIKLSVYPFSSRYTNKPVLIFFQGD